MIKHKLLLTVMLALLTTVAIAMEPINFHFTQYQVNQGLSENTVYCMTQDSRGFLWMGTKDGLNRFDGSTFRHYRHSESDPTGIGNNFIRSMFETSDYTLYIGTDIGACIMDIATETFTPICTDPGKGEVVTSAVNSLYHHRDGTVWMATMHQGVMAYNPADGTVRKIKPSVEMPERVAAWVVTGDQQGNIWVGTRMGLMRYNEAGDRLEPVEGLFSLMDNNEHEVLSILEDTHGNLWLGTWSSGVRFYNKQRYTGITYLDKNSPDHYATHVRVIFPYTNRLLMIGSDDGLFLFNLDTRLARRIDIPQSHNSLSDQNVYSIIRDNENGIWIGTYFGGANYMKTALSTIETYLPDVTPGMLFGRAVSQFCEDAQGNIWIATEDGGINHFNTRTRLITQPVRTSYHNTHALMMDGDDLWIGTFSRGIDIYNTRTRQLRNLRSSKTDDRTVNDDCVFSIYRTRAGEIYVGTTVGLNRYDRRTGTFTRIPEADGFVYDIREDHQGNLWVASYSEGVLKFNSTTGEWLNYKNILPPEHPIVGSKMTYIHIDARQRIIFASEGRGIFIYDEARDDFQQISEADGLPNGVIYGVLDDAQGRLWMSSNRGIICMDPNRPNTFRVFDREDGAQSNQYNYKSCFKASDGKFYFGGINGFNCFYPNDLDRINNANIPPIVLTDFALLGEPDEELNQYIRQTLAKGNRLVLPHNKASFTISYISLSYVSHTKNRYSYRLEGADNDWTPAGTKREVTYVNLPDGRYTFHVRGSNNSGVWNETGARLEIEILPPLWWSIEAKLFYLVLLLLSIWFTINYYVRKARRKQTLQLETFKAEQETRAFRSKIEFFTNIAHEIRTPVSLIKAPLEEVLATGEGSEETRQNLQIIDKNCNRLTVLINQLLDFRKMDASSQSLNPVAVDLRLHVGDLYERFRKTASKEHITFNLNVQPDVDYMLVSDPDMLTKIIGNLLTNAFKFTTDTVSLLLSAENGVFKVVVEDNGIGISDEQKTSIFDPFVQLNPKSGKPGAGIGLSLVKNLVRVMNGEINVVDAQPRGTRFIFTLASLATLPEPATVTTEPARPEPADTENTVVPSAVNPVGKQILVVDDNADITNFIRNTLSQDFTVHTALNTADAMSALDSVNYDLIITDIMMPVEDGISFTRRLKADVNYSHIPVILLSAKTDNSVKVEGLRAGAEAFIEKPFSTAFLKAQVSTLLESRKTLIDSFTRSPLAPFTQLATNRADEKFLEKLNAGIEKNLASETFTVDSLTEELGISRSSLQRKLKTICNMTPGDYLRTFRMKRACALLLEGELRINEVSYLVGFTSPSYFTRAFIKMYGMTPKEFMQEKSEG